MPHALNMASPGLQALILCGPGSSFPTFTSNPDENPKALLPIANRPMVWYPIDFCCRAGVTRITLVCPPSAAKAINTALNTNPLLTGLHLPKLEVLAPNKLDQTTGTAEIFRLPEVRACITSDFLVLPCDLVCELPGEKLLQAWMVQAASLSELLGGVEILNGQQNRHSGGLGVWYEAKTTFPVKGQETDFLAISPLQESTLPTTKDLEFPKLPEVVYSMPTASLKDLSEENNGLPIRHGLIRSYPRVRMLTTLRDAHLYIFPRWILDFIDQNPRLETIGEDVLGWWAKAGWQQGLCEKLKLAQILGKRDAREEMSSLQDEEVVSKGADGQEQHSLLPSSLTATPTHESQKSGPRVPPILAYIHPSQPSAPLICRVDTSALLLAVSLQLAKLPPIEEVGADAASPFAHARKVTYPEGVKSRTTITKQDSLIAENVSIEEKTSIKECVVGANCQINEGAKLHQCLLMDGVVVGKACKLTRCILGKRCVIGDGSILTDCEVQENLLVEAKTDDKDAKLMADGYEATEAEMQQVYEEMEEDLEEAVGATALVG